MAAMFFITACFSGNYLILMNDHFIVKSALCPFLKTILYYKEVRKIKFKNTMGEIYRRTQTILTNFTPIKF